MKYYLHLGQDTVVRQRDILGIFDLDNTSASPRTRRFLAMAQENGTLCGAGEDLPRSFVLCHDGRKTAVHLSQLSAGTLQRRAK